MRRTGKHLNRYRKRHPTLGKTPANSLYGYFRIPVDGDTLDVISSGEKQGAGELESWEHVSVSMPDKTPTWSQMCQIKDLFWKPTETVVQFHPTATKYVNFHESCLHLWRHDDLVSLPPEIAVGPTFPNFLQNP